MIPLFAPLVTRQSQANSKSLYSPSVTRSGPSPSPPFRVSTPSLIAHFSGNAFVLNPCQPAPLVPSKSAFHPAAFSASVSVLCARASFHSAGRVTVPVAAHSVPRASSVLNCGSIPEDFELSSLSHVCPRGVWKTRPLPYVSTRAIGSSCPVPPVSLASNADPSSLNSTFCVFTSLWYNSSG